MGHLRTVFPTPDVRNPESDIDIVFVHGLNPLDSKDHALGTWTHPNGTCWPANLLPGSVPGARVLLFAYNSNVAFNVASATIRSHATSLLELLFSNRNSENERHRPILFVSHSLGGLLVKQALVLAKTRSDRYDDLRKSTAGLMFFGTPHAGGKKAAIGKVVANILSVFTGQPRNNLLSTLKRNSLYHEIINDDFNPQLNDYEVISYCEERKTSIKIRHWAILPQASMLVVDRISAKLGSPGEILVGLDATHSDMCRFTGGWDDGSYQLVQSHIQELARKARNRRPWDGQAHVIDQENQADRIYYMVPHSQNPHFVGQVPILTFLRDFFSDKKHIRRAVLSGIGGVGKTQCAVQYCLLRRQQGGGHVFWINAETIAALTASFCNIFEGLSLQGKWSPGSFIRTWLGNRKDWLLVLDNVNKSTLRQVLELISQTDAGDVLITTRDSHVIGSQGFPYGTELSVLDDVNSMLLLVLNCFSWAPSELEDIRRIFVGPATISSYKDNLPSNIAALKDQYQIYKYSQLRYMVSLVGFLPLAVVQCASYLRQYPTGYSRFVLFFGSRLLKTRRDLYSHLERGATYDASIMTVWETTFQELEHTLPSSAEMLTLLGFLDRNLNSEDFLTDCLSDMQIWEGSARLSLDMQHRSSLMFLDSRRLDFDKSLGRLVTLSLITKSREKRRIILHPMVQEWVHLRMPKALCRQWLERALILLCHRVPPLLYSSADKSVPNQAELAFCHLERVSEMLELYLDGAKELAAECAVFFLEAYLWYRGDRYLDIAERLLVSTMSTAQIWVSRMVYSARLYQIVQKFQESAILAIDKVSYDDYSSKLSLASKPPSVPPPGTRFEITQAVIANRLCETLDQDVVSMKAVKADERDEQSTQMVSEGTRALLGSVPEFIPAVQPPHQHNSSIDLVCSALLAQCRAKDHIICRDNRRASQLLEQFKEGAALAWRYNLAELAQYFNILIRTKAAFQPGKHELEMLLRYVDDMCRAEILVQEWTHIESAFSGPNYAKETNSFILHLAGRPEFVKCFLNKGAFKDPTEEEEWMKRRLFTCREHFGPTAETYLDCARRLGNLYEAAALSRFSEAKDLYSDIIRMLENSGELKSNLGEFWAQRLWKIVADDNAYDRGGAISLCKIMMSAYIDDYEDSASSIQRWSKRLGDALKHDGKDDESLDILCSDMIALWMNTDRGDSAFLTYLDEWGLVAAGIIERRGGADSQEALIQHCSDILSFFQKKRPYRNKYNVDIDAACFSLRWATKVADLLEESNKQRWVEFCAATSAHFEANLDIQDEICVIWAVKNNHAQVDISERSTEYNEEMDHALCVPMGNIWDWTYHNLQICAQRTEESLSMIMASQGLGFDKASENISSDGGVQAASDVVPSNQPRRIRLPLGAVVRDRRRIMNAWHLGHHGGLWIARISTNVTTKEPPGPQEAESLLLWVRSSIVGVTYVNISPALTLYTIDESVGAGKYFSTLRILGFADGTSEILLRLQTDEEADGFSDAFAAAGGQIASRKIV